MWYSVVMQRVVKNKVACSSVPHAANLVKNWLKKMMASNLNPTKHKLVSPTTQRRPGGKISLKENVVPILFPVVEAALMSSSVTWEAMIMSLGSNASTLRKRTACHRQCDRLLSDITIIRPTRAAKLLIYLPYIYTCHVDNFFYKTKTVIFYHYVEE